MSTENSSQDRLEPIATRVFQPNDELYKVVDFLNKNLKHKRLMFGLTKDKDKNVMVITIYEI
ncbi:MAG: YpmA family protein [Armatimonadetes bacterium]|nr:YpmA family protein [Armatimonadota bacterium]